MVLKKTLAVIAFFILSLSVWSQTREIDSLLNVLQNTSEFEIKIKAYDRVSWALIDIDLEKAIAYNDTAFTLSEKRKYKEGIIGAYDNYVVLHRALGNYDKALNYLDEYDKLILGDTSNIAGAAFQRGVLNSIIGKYDESLKSYQKALKLYESLGNERGLGILYNTIGITYSNIKRYDEAIRNFELSIEKLEPLNDFNSLASTYANLASAYDYKNEDNKALLYFDKAILLYQKTSNARRIALNKQNISAIYKQQEQYGKALTNAKEAYIILKENNYQGESAGAAINLGDILRLTGDHKKSEEILLKQLNNRRVSATDQQNLYFNLSKLYETINKNKQALDYHKKYKILSDSLINEKGLGNLDKLQVKYDAEKKDRTILENELNLEKSKSKTRLMTILLISLLGAAILLWFVFQQRQKRIRQELVFLKKEQEILTLESLIAGEEKERLRISQELHDGVNGDLSAIKFKLSSLLKMNNEVINEAVTMIDNSCQQVRAISHNLVPPSLKDFNLVEAIQNYCEDLNESHQEVIHFQPIGDPITLSKKVEINIFRIVQELVTNAIKHANAQAIDVQLSHSDNLLLLTVEDDGKGYNKEAVGDTGIGLSNIDARIQYLNATLDVITNDKGTSNTIEIELTKLEAV